MKNVAFQKAELPWIGQIAGAGAVLSVAVRQIYRIAAAGLHRLQYSVIIQQKSLPAQELPVRSVRVCVREFVLHGDLCHTRWKIQHTCR